MAEVLLQSADVDSGLQQMSGVAVTQTVHTDSPSKLRLCHDLPQRALHGGFGHRLPRVQNDLSFRIRLRKQQRFVSMCLPVLSQRMQSDQRHRNEPVLCSLASVNMDAHAFGIDIPHLQRQSFVESQATRTDRQEVRIKSWLAKGGEDASDFGDGGDGRKLLLARDAKRSSTFQSSPQVRR